MRLDSIINRMETPKECNNYFWFHYKALRILGIGKWHAPEENNFDNYPNLLWFIYGFLCTLINIIGYTLSETLFAVKVYNDDREASLQFLAFTMVGVHLFATVKILILIKKNESIQKIVKVIVIDSKQYAKDEDVIDQSMMFTKIVTGCFFVMGEITITCMSIYSLIEDFKRKRILQQWNNTITIPRDTPFTAYVPWDTSQDGPYFIAFIYCIFGMYWMGSTLIVGDTMIASIMTHISGQFRMVQRVVENIGNETIDILEKKLERANIRQDKKVIFKDDDVDAISNFVVRKKHLMKHFSQEHFNETMIDCLKKAIQYHQMIIEITNELQAAYSTAFLCQTLSSFYVIGLILVQTALDVSDLYSLRFYNNLGFLFSILWQLFSQTYSAHEITLEAEKVSFSAYSSIWYEVENNKKIGRLLLIIMIRAQKPIYLTAGSFAPLSNTLFLFIVKSSYQIFTLINTAIKGDHTQRIRH